MPLEPLQQRLEALTAMADKCYKEDDEAAFKQVAIRIHELHLVIQYLNGEIEPEKYAVP